MTKQARGIRNNNPGNIRNSERNDWKGEVSKADKKDQVFEEFETMSDGVRAMMRLLQKYQRSYNLHTVKEIVERWAPRNENDTAAYVRTVCKEMQMPECCGLDLTDKGTMCALVDAMCYVENGVHIDMADIEAGWEKM
ncbi:MULTISPECIES: hypothetical protein [Parabacteroides]|uniref:Structural protein P5 n=3 Tax=Parabacteroides goldsteinii TaxID=328812 RepID=A0A6G1ZFU9_9BACT|nr:MULTISPECIES: hypothetical protein [Parabacteroides]EOS17499.1 hypothetical protein C803_02511 [Parabacteroides goldsteinii dnLKV18]KAI4359848.1 hypothetical protein C825_001895 [Parabacteroides sp. ASF519]MBF0763320.1 hypothetical protein [Parabacteroides goldsteinii]MDZ3928471.1 hypothetical protein [Parabacteroides goldsteinii]MRX95017.1 hypothetical protein [Parabacteroides goldsteinii]